MRPIERGPSPEAEDFENYRDAFVELRSRLGPYCSYCERRIPTNLAVEHIQAKEYTNADGERPYAHLKGRWDNFLLACVNCNSTKGDKNVLLYDVLLPDRDNTSAAYVYRQDGVIEPSQSLSLSQTKLAAALLRLVGLDKPRISELDSNGRLVSIDRVGDRAEAFSEALDSLADYEARPTDAMARSVVRTARANGFFSIWMTVFADHPSLRRAFVESFPGTCEDCFDLEGEPISPRGAAKPELAYGGKV